MKTQNDKILAHLRAFDEITAFEALSKYGVMRLAARINDLRGQGYNIATRMIQHPTTKRHYAAYSIAGR